MVLHNRRNTHVAGKAMNQILPRLYFRCRMIWRKENATVTMDDAQLTKKLIIEMHSSGNI